MLNYRSWSDFFGSSLDDVASKSERRFPHSRLRLLRLRFLCGTFRLDGRGLFGLLFLLVLIPHRVFYRIETLLRCSLLGEGSTIRHTEFVQCQLVSL